MMPLKTIKYYRMNNKLIIIGGGEHGKVIADAAFKQNRYKVVGFVDDSWPLNVILDDGLPVLGRTKDAEEMAKLADFFIVAIKHNKEREFLFKKFSKYLKAATVIHPSAVISMNTTIGDGSVVLANSVLSVNVKLGFNVIVNSMVFIDHDSVIGNHAHLAPGTIIGNNMEIKSFRNTLLGEIIASQSFNKYI